MGILAYSPCMRELRFVSDGDEPDAVIVAEDDDTERFVLRVDDALRTAVGTPAAKPRTKGSTATKVGETVLTPREIQVRVRAGEDPAELAEETGADLDRVMRFAEAVVAERLRVADEARRSRARREGDGVLVPFGETVDRRFVAHGIEASAVAWDSYRREDGSWTVVASWQSGEVERVAHWAFNLASRTLMPADEPGADLLSDRPLRPVVQAVPDEAEIESVTVVVAERVYDQEADYDEYYPDTDYLSGDTDRPSRPRRGRPTPVPQQEGPQPPSAGQPSDTDTRRAGVPALRLADPLPMFEETHGDGEPEEDDIIPFDSYDEPAEEPVARSAAPARRGSGRSKAAKQQTKIPSWDDILLGVRRKSD